LGEAKEGQVGVAQPWEDISYDVEIGWGVWLVFSFSAW
jgi:hypothetical protein